jgi:hypothetical protein
MTRRAVLIHLLQQHITFDDGEEADRCAMLRLAHELADPLSREEPRAHFTASAYVVDEEGLRTCLVEHPKLARLLQPGGHIEPSDISLEAAALREAREETTLEVELHSTAPRPLDAVCGGGLVRDRRRGRRVGEQARSEGAQPRKPASGLSSSGLSGSPGTGSLAL